jgi:hypothetical protein
MTTRYSVVNQWPWGQKPASPLPPPTFLPEPPAPPIIANSDYVFLYLHGHSSRIEEASDLIPMLFRVAAEHGQTVSVVVLDLPGLGTQVGTTRPPALI